MSTTLLKTPLNEVHRRLGAKMVDFGGWDMPVQYKGILDEHKAVRTGAGLFDVSHMGEIVVKGPQALEFVNWFSSNDATKLKDGQIHYSGLLYEHGGFVDDILVHRVNHEEFFICVNASNQDKDYEYILGQAATRNLKDLDVENAGGRYAQLAIQGPLALELCQKLTALDLASIRYYWFQDGEFAGRPARVARTGYTGEDGFEVYVAPEFAEEVWNKVMELGAVPCGLGARNTLRLEAKMALYGHEIDTTITPLEADLAWIVKFDKPDFLGKAALLKQKEAGLTRKLVGFEMRGRGIGRDGYEVNIDGSKAGWVTSGGPAPTLNKNIGLCYLPIEKAVAGQAIEIMIRQQAVEAEVVPTPFYKRAK